MVTITRWLRQAFHYFCKTVGPSSRNYSPRTDRDPPRRKWRIAGTEVSVIITAQEINRVWGTETGIPEDGIFSP